MSHMAPEEILGLSGIEDIEIPCDYDDEDHNHYPVWPKPHGGARWVGRLAPCVCGLGGVRLLCDSCKGFVLAVEAGASCPACAEIIFPFRHAFQSIEPL